LRTILAFLSLIALTLATGTVSAAGISIGNGGHSLACTDSSGRVGFETFDLYEGRALFGYAYPQDNPNLDPFKLARSLASRMDQALTTIPGFLEEPVDNLASKVDYVRAAMKFLPPGVGLKGTGDIQEFIEIPANCKFVQTVNFRDSNLVYVNTDAWNALDRVSQAALYLHEAVYWYMRETGVETDSRRARKAVAYMMSGGSLTPRTALPSGIGKAQFCRSRNQNPETWDWDTKLFAYRDHSGALVLQFLQIDGHRVITKTTLSAQVSGGISEFPIDARAQKVRSVTAALISPIDVDAILKIKWGMGNISLTGTMQPHDTVNDPLVCDGINF
jgi:hypothetical protein